MNYKKKYVKIMFDIKADVAELVDALDLGSSKFSCGGSSPPNRNLQKFKYSGYFNISSLVIINRKLKYSIFKFNDSKTHNL